MFHPGLWKLIQLRWKGGFRQFRRSLKTARGLFQLAFCILLLSQGIFTAYFTAKFSVASSPFAGPFQPVLNDFLSLGLFAATCYIVLFSSGEATVYFTSSEIAFLFPAPLTRRQLLSYKLLGSLFGMIAVALLFTILMTAQIRMAVPRVIALVLTLSFMQLLTMNIAFARQVLREKLHIWLRIGLGVAIAGVVLIAANQALESVATHDLGEVLKAFQNSATGKVLLAPFHVFTQAIRAEDWRSFVPSALVLILIDTLMVILAFWLDALSLEAAVAISEKMTMRLKRLQAGGIWRSFELAKSDIANRRMWRLPFWTGIGPILWQKMTTLIRSSAKIFVIPVLAVAAAAFIVYKCAHSSSHEAGFAPFFGIAIIAYASVLVCLTIQNEIERVAYLKSLPLTTRSIVMGDLIGIPCLISILQSLFVVGEAWFFTEMAGWLLACACLTAPMNFLLFGIDKLVFYIYPTRLAKGAPGDFQMAGRQMLFMFLKVLIMFAAIIVVAVFAAIGFLLLRSEVVGFIFIMIAMAVECVVLVPLLVQAFDRFDPGVTIVS